LVRELDPELGMQVHRSYWVNRAAIEFIRPGAKKFSVRLRTGTDLPISAPYHGLVKEMARNSGLPVRG
jgi:DNA-binding LytR/AlgR family response regulator